MHAPSRLVTTFLGLAVLGSPVPAGAQAQSSSEERFFGIQWQLERAEQGGAVIVGSVHNRYLYPLQRVLVEAKVVDPNGQVVQEVRAPMADIPPGARGTFRLTSPVTGARYVVTVHSFEFGSQQSP